MWCSKNAVCSSDMLLYLMKVEAVKSEHKRPFESASQETDQRRSGLDSTFLVDNVSCIERKCFRKVISKSI